MKKIILLLTILFSVTSFSQLALEGFESGTFPPTTPANWAVFDNGVNATPAVNWASTNVATNVYTGTTAAFMRRPGNIVGTVAQDYLATPSVNVPTNGQIKFYTKNLLGTPQPATKYQVRIKLVSDGPQNDPANYVLLQEWVDPNLVTTAAVYEQKTVNIPATYFGQSVYVALCMQYTQPAAATVGNTWCIDDFQIIAQCNSPAPTSLNVSSVFDTSAVLGWTATGGSISYDIENVLQSASFTGTPSGSTNTNSFQINVGTLTASTGYQYRVRSNCGPGNIGAWVGPFNYFTSATPPGCGASFYDEGGLAGNYSPNSNAAPITICPGNPLDVVTVTFTSFNTESGRDGLYVYDGNSTNINNLIPKVGNLGTNVPGGLDGAYWGTTIPGPFTSTSVDGCLTFKFRSDSSTQNAGWVANVTCGPRPPCSTPSSVVLSAITTNSVTVNWTQPANPNATTATAWEYLNLPSGSPAPTSTTTGTAATSTTLNLTNLASGSCYEFYVRAICSATESSKWTSVKGYCTPIGPLACGGNYADTGGVGPTAAFNYSNDENVTKVICPTNPGDLVTVTFTAFETEVDSNGLGYDGLYVYNGNTATSPIIDSYNPVGNNNGPLTTEGAWWGTTNPGPFESTSPDGCLTFVFKSDSSVTKSGWLSNITCNPRPACFKPNTLTVSAITTNSATLSWVNSGTATSWQVIALPTGSPAPSSTFTGFFIANSSPFIYGAPNTPPLNQNTTYDFYIRGNCGPVNGLSLWAGPKTFTTLPTCPRPTITNAPTIITTTTTATFGWTENGTATNWEMIAVPCGAPAPTNNATPVTGTTVNPGTILNLNPDTCYDFYVRSVCSFTDSSNWSVVQTATTQQLPPQCGGQYIDNGGSAGDYQGNSNVVTTICPTIPGQLVTVTFTDFDTEANWDGIYVFDGNSVNADPIKSDNQIGFGPMDFEGAFWGNTIPGPFTSSSADGCLTFWFLSDGSFNNPGFIANVTCGPPPTCRKPNSLTTAALTQTGATLGWTQLANPDGSNSTAWEYLILPTGSNPPTATAAGGVITNSSTGNVVTSQAPAGCYDYYVRSVCSATDSSPWAGPKKFCTLIANDECANATVVGVNPDTICVVTAPGSLLGATGSSQPNSCPGTDDDDVWFKFVATSTSHSVSLIDITGSVTNLNHAVYSGTSCGNLTQIYCSNPDQSVGTFLTVGATYYVRVYSDTATGGQNTTFNICIGTPPPVPLCNSNVVPFADDCPSAPPICNFNGYCGNTANYTDENNWPELNTAFCGSIENNSFATFVASDTTLSLNFWVTSSTDGNGVQFMLFKAATCGSGPVEVITCFSPNGGNVPIGPTNITATGLTVGETYYFMVDGYAGDVCDYVLTPAAGGGGIFTSVDVTSPKTTICLGETTTLNATGGNSIYNWSPATGLNTVTGPSVIFTPTTSGTFTIAATATDGNIACPQSTSDNIVITVTDPATPITNFSYSAAEYCTNGINPVPQSSPAVTSGGVYSATPSGLSINAVTGIIDLCASTPGTYFVKYNIANSLTNCLLAGESPEVTVKINQSFNVTSTLSYVSPSCKTSANQLPTVSSSGIAVCGTAAGSTLPVSVVGTYTVTPLTSPGLDINSTTGEINFNNSIPNTYTITYTVATNAATCNLGGSTTFELTIKPDIIPVTQFTYTSPVCKNGVNPLPTKDPSFTEGGTFSASPNTLNINTSTGEINLNASPAATYTVFYDIPANPAICLLAGTKSATITLNAVKTPSFTQVSPICQNDVLPVLNTSSNDSPPIVGVWTATGNSNVAGTIVYNFVPNPNQCASVTSMNVIVKPNPVFTIDGACQSSNYTLEVVPTNNSFDINNASFSWTKETISIGSNSQDLVIDKNGIYNCKVTVNGCETIVSKTVTDAICTIQKGISPNGDNKNEEFDLTSLNVKLLNIYNRYGAKVYSKENYTKEWIGQSDSNQVLPDATYYYIAELGDGTTKNGWVYINKEN